MAVQAWPDWWKAIVGIAMIGVPVVLWLASTNAMAQSAEARSLANQERIRMLEMSEARNEERWRSVLQSLERIEKKLFEATK